MKTKVVQPVLCLLPSALVLRSPPLLTTLVQVTTVLPALCLVPAATVGTWVQVTTVPPVVSGTSCVLVPAGLVLPSPRLVTILVLQQILITHLF